MSAMKPCVKVNTPHMEQSLFPNTPLHSSRAVMDEECVNTSLDVRNWVRGEAVHSFSGDVIYDLRLCVCVTL